MLAASLLFCAVACGTQSPPGPGPSDSEKPAPVVANTGQLTVHVKDMVKRLNLV